MELEQWININKVIMKCKKLRVKTDVEEALTPKSCNEPIFLLVIVAEILFGHLRFDLFTSLLVYWY